MPHTEDGHHCFIVTWLHSRSVAGRYSLARWACAAHHGHAPWYYVPDGASRPMLESSHLGLLVLAHAPLSRRAWQISDSTGTWETSCGHVSMRHHAIYLLDVLLDLDGFDGCFGVHQHQDQETCKMLGRGFSGALSVWWRPWFGYAYRWFGRALLRRSWFTKVLQIYSRERHIWQLIGDDRDIVNHIRMSWGGRMFPISMRRRKTLAHGFARTLLWTFAWGWSLLELASSSVVCLVLVTIASTDILTFTARLRGCFHEKHTQTTKR